MYLSSLHSIEEFLKRRSPRGELYISGTGKRPAAIRRLASEKGVPVHSMSGDEITRLSGIDDHKGVVLSLPAEAGPPEKDLEAVLHDLPAASALVVLLDGITDPHNLGAVLRSAEQFGADCLILPRRRNASLSDTVARVSAGAVEYVQTVTVPNLPRAMELLKQKGFWIYGADMAGESVDRTDFRGRVAVVLGSEGSGLSRLVRERCDAEISIPVSGKLNSLNVSVAAGIIMYEVRRQQGFG